MSFRPPQGSPNAKRGRTPPPEDTFEEASFLKTLGMFDDQGRPKKAWAVFARKVKSLT